MTISDDDIEVKDLSEIYDALRDDAKQIVRDLHGGVVMWREAAGANVATAGFLFILALTSFHYYSPLGFETTAIIVAEIALALVVLGMAAVGFRKYFRLRRRYQGLFERAKKLD